MKLVVFTLLFSVLGITFCNGQSNPQPAPRVIALLELVRSRMPKSSLQIRDGYAGSTCVSNVDCKTGRQCVRSICAVTDERHALCSCADFSCDADERCIAGNDSSGICFSESIAERSFPTLLDCDLETNESIRVAADTEETIPREEPSPSAEPGPTVSTTTIPTPTPTPTTTATVTSTTTSPPPSPSVSAPIDTEPPRPSTSTNPSSVCVDAGLLSDFAPHELVFNTHSLAPVLCDPSGSCATKGHIVQYKGAAMMMGSYCQIVQCEEHVMEVNSPIRKRGLKVETKSKDLQFTAFSARYETRAEEFVLSAVVHAGM